jgi:hypothetical protein
VLLIYILNILSSVRSGNYFLNHVSYAARTNAYAKIQPTLIITSSKIVICVPIFSYYIINLVNISGSGNVYTYIGSVDGRAWLTAQKGGTCDTCHATHIPQRVTYYHMTNTTLTCHICVLPNVSSHM